MNIQKCILCNEAKPLDDFYKHSEMANGYLGICKSCHKLRVKLHAQTPSGKLVEKKRNQNPKRRAALAEIARLWRINNPEKSRAHSKVQRAIKAGKLIRPTKCERCESEGRIHAHHADYSKPLEVEWLCVPCHGTEHPNFIPFQQ